MSLVLKHSAVAALASTAAGDVLGAMPSQTVGGCGEPLFALPLPTEPPSLELAKRRLEKKDVTDITNICTEWTIPGGFGQPQCGSYQTCLFTSASGKYYEGCGELSIAYNWVTECFNYPQTGVPPVSQLYCPATAPYCGYFAFVFGVDYTFWNFGCSTVPYKLFVDLLPSTTGVVLAGGGTSQITPIATTIYVTQQPSNTGATATVLLAPGASQQSLPSSKTSPPTGAIVGGVIGGIALIAFISFLVWFIIRKRRKDKKIALAETRSEEQRQQQADAAAAAFQKQNQNRLPEMGGTPKPAFAYMQPPSPRRGSFPDKPVDGNHSAYVENTHPGSRSPPPSYPQSPQSGSSILNLPSDRSELEERRVAGSSPTDLLFWQGEQREVNELGGSNRESWNVPPRVQELGSSAGGVNRRLVAGQGTGHGRYDMSGAPMSEGHHPHELE